MDRRDLVLLLLPWILFVIPFRLTVGHIIVSMALISSALGLLAIFSHREIRGMIKLDIIAIFYGLIYALTLYILSLIGHVLLSLLGLGWQVELVYSSINIGYLELALIPIIGFMEEVYWRGYLQEILVRSRLRVNWIFSAIPYALVHLTSSLIALVLAAGVVGLILGLSVRTRGLTSSITAHITWLYLILYIIPMYKIL